MANRARPPQPDEEPPSILNLVKQVQYKAYIRLEAVFQPLGVTALQFRILTTIDSRPGLTSAELARVYDVKPQTMVRQVGLLEGKGLIERQENSANKRLLDLRLTAAGSACLAKCREGAMTLEHKLLDPLDSAEREQLRSALAKVRDAMGPLERERPESDVEEATREYRRAGVQRI